MKRYQEKSVLFYIGTLIIVAIMTLTTIDIFSRYDLREKIIVIMADVIAGMAIIVWYDSERFNIIGRILSGIIFLAFASYLVHELYFFIFEGKPISASRFEPGPSLVKAIWGFVVFGIPAFLLAVRGYLLKKRLSDKVKRNRMQIGEQDDNK